jgi:hypothetical protein
VSTVARPVTQTAEVERVDVPDVHAGLGGERQPEQDVAERDGGGERADDEPAGVSELLSRHLGAAP